MSEGINFNPTSQKPVTHIDKSLILDRDLDDIVKENRKIRRQARIDRNKSRPKSETRKIPKKSTRARSVEKKVTKKVIRKNDAKKPTSKAIEIPLPQSALRSILSEAGVDTEGYSLRLIAKRKQ